MATQNINALVHIKDGNGNVNNIYPQTKIENVDGLEEALATKGTYSKPSGGIPKTDLASAVQTSLGKADTALQSETYKGTVTSVKVGSTSYNPSSGVVSLPAYPTTLPASDVSSWAKASSKPSYTQDEVTDGTTYKRVTSTEKTTWNNKGTYSKPSGGIPKTDLASAVQTSLGKADTALQSFTETDPTVPSWAKASSKPSYTASEVGAIATTAKGAANGVAELDANGKVPSAQLPSYVDDVSEYSAKSSFPTTGETGKIYVDTSNNKTYRWSGSAYVEISPSLALGTTSSTAYRGDRGNTAYTHATDSSRLTTATASGLYKVASTAQGHIASLTAVAKADITALGIPAQDTTYSAATQSSNGLMSSTDKTKLDGIETGANKITVDSSLSSTSTNPVQNKVINTALSGKQATLTFDGTYNASTNKAATVSTVTNALDALDLAEVSVGSVKTIDKISQTNGKVTVSTTSIRSASTSQTGIVQLNSTLASTSTTQAATASTVKSLNDTMTTGTVNRASAIPMGKCDDTSTSTAFTATVEGITELKDGVCVWLTNGVVNCASGFTVNINGLGAKGMYSNKTGSRISGYFTTNINVLAVYNTSRDSGNGGWDIITDDNTTYSNASLGQGYGTCTTAASTTAKVVSLSSYALTTGGIVSVKFSYDVPASATMNINSKGAKAIYYRGAAITAGVIKAGDTATFIYSTYYHLISIDRDENTTYSIATQSEAGLMSADDKCLMYQLIALDNLSSVNISAPLYTRAQYSDVYSIYQRTVYVTKAQLGISDSNTIAAVKVTSDDSRVPGISAATIDNANNRIGVTFTENLNADIRVTFVVAYN